MIKIPELIERELKQLKVPHQVKAGKRHTLIVVNGAFCGILPKNGKSNTRRAELNVRAQIRRAAKA